MDARRLSYLQAMGIDVWLPRDARLAGHGTSPGAMQPRTASEGGGLATEMPVPIAPTAASDAVAGMDWPALEAAVASCTRCDLHRTRTRPVFGVGNRRARLMVIGEAPGAEEDRQGLPFVGRAGELLNAMLRAIGLTREQVFIANILKSRPPGNRDPRPDEIRACLPYLLRQIELVDPTAILCVGRIAAQSLLDTDAPLGRLRGRVYRLGAAERAMIVTYHPAYLLRSPAEKRRSWEDLLLALRQLELRPDRSEAAQP